MLISGTNSTNPGICEEIKTTNGAMHAIIQANGSSVSNAAPLPTEEQRYLGFTGTVSGDTVGIEGKIKGTTQTLYGGAINASVSETNATEINMSYCSGGSLEVVENSGTGSWSFALYEKSTSGGVFTPGLTTAGAAITIAIPDGGGTVDIGNIRAKYIKWVPTLTGTSNVTVKWTQTPE